MAGLALRSSGLPDISMRFDDELHRRRAETTTSIKTPPSLHRWTSPAAELGLRVTWPCHVGNACASGMVPCPPRLLIRSECALGAANHGLQRCVWAASNSLMESPMRMTTMFLPSKCRLPSCIPVATRCRGVSERNRNGEFAELSPGDLLLRGARRCSAVRFPIAVVPPKRILRGAMLRGRVCVCVGGRPAQKAWSGDGWCAEADPWGRESIRCC